MQRSPASSYVININGLFRTSRDVGASAYEAANILKKKNLAQCPQPSSSVLWFGRQRVTSVLPFLFSSPPDTFEARPAAAPIARPTARRLTGN